MKEENKGFLSWLKDNWPWLAPVSYIYVTYVGMVQAYNLFKNFGLSIFEFAELNDFLLAAFQNPWFFLFVLLPFLFTGIFLVAITSIKKWVLYRGDSFQSPGRIKAAKFCSILILGGLVILFPIWAQLTSKEDVLADENRKIRLLVSQGDKSKNVSGWIEKMRLIGTTEKFIFVYNEKTDTKIAIPQSNVYRLEFNWNNNGNTGLGYTPEPGLFRNVRIENFFSEQKQKTGYELIDIFCCFDMGEHQASDSSSGDEHLLNSIVEKIRNKSKKMHLGQLIIVGGVDKIKLSHAREKQYGSNLGLAQARAEWISDYLKKRLGPYLKNCQILTLVSGPKESLRSNIDIENWDEDEHFREDRSVRIYGSWFAKE
ncbi:hypothetical protein [Desulfospira joergensenii]|uniref:hypothetical protein n=1 Tax=Desulfospira joergensenii TaxID=53329 RepID=UPI00048173E5|nr:hypothetical protein [Desulfospira joergensenii]